MPNPSFDSLLSATVETIQPELNNAIAGQIALIAMLQEQGYKRTLDPALNIDHRVAYQFNNTVKAQSKNDAANTNQVEWATVAQYPFCIYTGACTLPEFDKWRNSGSKGQIVNYATEAIDWLRESFTNQLNVDLITSTGAAGKINGLAIITEHTGSFSIVGGIDSNVDLWWRPQLITGVGAFATTNNGMNAIRKLYRLCMNTHLQIAPDLFITDGNGYDAYEGQAFNQLRLVRNKATDLLAELGFESLAFKNAAIIWDENAAANVWKALSTKVLRWNVGSGYDIKMFPPAAAWNNPLVTTVVGALFGNLTSTNRTHLGSATGFTYP